MGKRRQHSAEFKSRVALEALRGLKTVNGWQETQWDKRRIF